VMGARWPRGRRAISFANSLSSPHPNSVANSRNRVATSGSVAWQCRSPRY
jgi:hypothetical protein